MGYTGMSKNILYLKARTWADEFGGVFLYSGQFFPFFFPTKIGIPITDIPYLYTAFLMSFRKKKL